jgi:hypothetical protein
MCAAESKSWKDLYQSALLEVNPVKFNELLREAQKAIESRLTQLQERSADREEFHALQDALANLRALSKSEE